MNYTDEKPATGTNTTPDAAGSVVSSQEKGIKGKLLRMHDKVADAITDYLQEVVGNHHDYVEKLTGDPDYKRPNSAAQTANNQPSPSDAGLEPSASAAARKAASVAKRAGVTADPSSTSRSGASATPPTPAAERKGASR
ncbi:MAG: hypothetical protein MK052_12210 [Alphaproteobacteria bacterium]|nr:hypothetical protein [Alphaproteobacteria bacterium]